MRFERRKLSENLVTSSLFTNFNPNRQFLVWQQNRSKNQIRDYYYNEQKLHTVNGFTVINKEQI